MLRTFGVAFAVLLSFASCVTPPGEVGPLSGGDAGVTGLSSGTVPLASGALHWAYPVSPTNEVTLHLENGSTEPVLLHFSVRRQKVGTTTTYEERQVGTEEIEYCDPVTQECYTTLVPIYELVPVKEPVYAEVRVQPRRLTLAAGETATAHVTRNPSQAELYSTASVVLRIGGALGTPNTIAVFFGGPAAE